jgi:hypothetical protein
MNNRIKELAEEAGFRYIKDEGIGWAGNHNASLPRFAELIVRECVRHFNEDYERNFDTLWREDLSKSIKQHFGVKE